MDFLDQALEEEGPMVSEEEVIPVYRQSFSLRLHDSNQALLLAQYHTVLLCADRHSAVLADVVIDTLSLIPVGQISATQVLQLLRRRVGPLGEELLDVLSSTATSSAAQKYGTAYALPSNNHNLLVVKWTKEYAVHSAMYDDLCRQLLDSREVLLLTGKLLYSDPVEPLSIQTKLSTTSGANISEGSFLHRILSGNKALLSGAASVGTGLSEVLQSQLDQLPADLPRPAVLFATLQVDVNDFFTTKSLVAHLHQQAQQHFSTYSNSGNSLISAEQKAAFDSIYDRWKRVTQVSLGNMYM